MTNTLSGFDVETPCEERFDSALEDVELVSDRNRVLVDDDVR